VTVKPNAKNGVGSGAGGKANRELLDLLSAHFGAPKSTIKIVHGHSARRMIIDID
jgi:uncharacterized protein YggU (UPF0235/DUF167 family)